MQTEVKINRQHTQVVTAPRDGIVLGLASSGSSSMLKEGDKIATFVPITENIATELYVNPNDIPLLHPGRKVRLQFEGWPAMQFSGWPSIAIGTFGGVVSFVDPSVSPNGKFRIIVIEDRDDKVAWPNSKYLRQGAKVIAYVTLNKVSLGYELWRKINNFPPKLDAPLDISSFHYHDNSEKQSYEKKV